MPCSASTRPERSVLTSVVIFLGSIPFGGVLVSTSFSVTLIATSFPVFGSVTIGFQLPPCVLRASFASTTKLLKHTEHSTKSTGDIHQKKRPRTAIVVARTQPAIQEQYDQWSGRSRHTANNRTATISIKVYFTTHEGTSKMKTQPVLPSPRQKMLQR